ncbi:MAG TPA: zinc-binding dehydrogenase [Pseudonocardia sp.]|nr:zinc-binding dehydrogenase [Pseudonocardia sp.]
MKAVRVMAFGAPPAVEAVPDPEPRPGETLVRVAAAALGHLDRTVASGGFPMAPDPPYTPGVEGAGTVVGGGDLPPGTAVWLRGGGLGTARDGTAAELVAVPDAAVHPAPPGADPALAACFFSPATSAWCAVHDVGGSAPGERVAVTGAGGAVGALAVQLAAEAGASAVLAVVSRPERAEAVPVVAGRVEVVVGGLDPAVHGADRPVDLLVDTVGGPDLPRRLACVAPGGRAVLVGYTAGAAVTLDLPALMARDVRLLPLNMVRRAETAFGVADALLRRLCSGELALPVTAYPLAAVDRAWSDLGAGRVRGRVVVVP